MQSLLNELFLTGPIGDFPLATGTYDPKLVLLSLLAAILASGIALQLASVARHSGTAGLRVMALVTGAFALGAGVWSMHFIGMLAFQLCTHVTFDPWLTAISALPSFAASLLTLALLSRRDLSVRALLVGGVAVGAGIGLMHYTGMAAMQMSLLLRYDPAWFALSIGVAVAFAVLALWVRFGLRDRWQLSDRLNLTVSAVVMGVAIAGMHYTAMRAARFIGAEDETYLWMTSQSAFFAVAIAFTLLLVCCLATVVNLMLRYRHLYREHQRAEQALRNDLTQRRAMEADLRLAKERAELAAKSKSAFLANMSHEIRTPMNAIIGFTDVVLESTLTKIQRNHLETVSRSAHSLLGLLNDILDTAKLENGAVELESEDFSLHQVCVDVVATLQLSAVNKGLALDLAYASDLPHHFKGDALRLQQVLLNLVGNAIKFTEAGRVDLRVAREGAEVLIEVEDTGLGIEADRLDKIFEAFAQADASTTRRFGGTGLGTTIARQFVRLMGGDIGVRSTVGRGSCFWVRLPLAAGVEPKREAVADLVKLPPLRILVADDVVQNGELLQLRLGRLGHAVSVAHDGEQALAAVVEGGLDLVLMDVQMPVLDGEMATRAIREREHRLGLPRLPVIALTAGVLDRDRHSALDAGMDGFAVKPVDLRKLTAEMARVLQVDTPETAPTAASSGLDAAGDGVDWTFGIDLWGDRATLQTRIGCFARDTLPTLDVMADLRGPERRSAAHRIKGAAANLALSRVTAIAARLEHPELDDDQSQSLWHQVRGELAQLQDHLGARVPLEGGDPPASPNLSLAELTCLARSLERGEFPEADLERLYAGLGAQALKDLQAAVENFEFDRAATLVKAMILAA